MKLQHDRHDVCFVGESMQNLKKVLFHPQSEFIEEGFAKVASFTVKFCKKNNFKLTFINKYPESHREYNNEINFYKKYLVKSEFDYLINNLKKYILIIRRSF